MRDRCLKWNVIAYVSLGLLVISLLPIIYLSFFNYATGDDLGYGAALHRVIVSEGSLSKAVAAVVGNVKGSWYSFQGTWSSIALFSVEPSVYGERWYTVTTWIALFCLIFCQGRLLYELCVRIAGMERSVFVTLASFLLIIETQYMPYHRSGLFWYTGMAHYVIPYGACMLSMTWMLRYLRTGKKKYLIAAVFAHIYISGAGYPEVVLMAVFDVFLFFVPVFARITKRFAKEGSGISDDRAGRDTSSALSGGNALSFIPHFCLLMAGFAVSAIAPGNKVRGGEGFGFSAANVVSTLGRSLEAGVTDAVHFMITVRPLILLVILAVLCTWETLDVKKDTDRRERLTFRYPWIVIPALYLIFSAVHAPELYVGEDVGAGISGGVYNSYFFVFLVCLFLGTVYLTAFIKTLAQAGRKSVKGSMPSEDGIQPATKKNRISGSLSLVFLLFCAVFCIVFRSHLIGGTTDYVALDFIRSGAFDDYREQMRERLLILEDPTVKDAVLAPMNDYQGPLMHMPVGGDPTAFTNDATARFYGKHSVIAK